MAEKKIYQHHERDSEAGAISDIQTREIVFSSDIDYLLYETAASTVRYVFTMSEDAISESAGVVTFSNMVIVAGALVAGTSLDINASTVVTGVLDQDSMADDSNEKLCTQQSIKAYVDSQISGGTYWDRTGTVLSTNTADDDLEIGNGFLTVDTTTLVVNAPGYLDRVGIGTATPAAKFTVVEGAGEFRINQTSIDYFSTNPGITNNPARINAYRSREGAVVDDADNLFWLIAYGHDGTDLNTQAAAIKISVDETAQTVTTNRVPTKIEFQTAEGAGDNDNSTKLTILPDGNVGIGVSDPDSLLEVAGTTHIQGATTLDSTLTVATSLDIGSSIAVTGVLDEDNMISDSNLKLCTQQSIKKYVDDQILTTDTWAEVLANGNTSGANDVTISGNQKIYFNDTNSYIGDPVPNGVVGLVISDTSRINISSDEVYIGDGSTADILSVYSGSSNGQFKWESVADYFQFYDDILMRTAEKIYFRDTALSISSSADTFIDYIADGAHRFTGAVTMDTSLDIGSSTVVTGVLDQDDMSSDSNEKLCTQQSIKKYVDDQILTTDTWAEVLANGNTSGATDVIIDAGQSLTVDTNTLVVNASGYVDKVGIGTVTPGAKVEILADTNKSVQIGDTAGPFTTATYFSDLATLGAVINLSKPDNGGYAAALFTYDTTAGASNNVGLCHGSGDLVIASNTLETMRIERGGDIGIGTASPGAKVEILGDTNKSVQIGSTAGSFTTVTYFSDLATLGAVINLSKPDNGNYIAALFTYDTTAGASNNVGLCHAAGDLVIASDTLETMRIERGGNVSLNGDLSLSSAATTITITDSGSSSPVTIDLDTNVFTINSPSGSISLTSPSVTTDGPLTVGTDLTVTGNDINDVAGAWLTSDGAGGLKTESGIVSFGTAFNSAVAFNFTHQSTALSGTTQVGMQIDANFGTAATAQSTGLELFHDTAVTTTVSNALGLNIHNLGRSGAATVNNQYALYIDSLSGATTNYAIYTAGAGLVYFGDDTEVASGQSFTVDTNTLVVNASGYGDQIGIGTATPDGTVNIVSGTPLAVTAPTSSNDLVIENGSDAGISILASDAGASQINFGSPTDNFGAYITWGHNADKLSIGTYNAGADIVFGTGTTGTTALTLDDSQDATFASDVTVNGLTASKAVFTDSAKKLVSKDILACDITRTRLTPSVQTVTTGTLTSGTVSNVQDWEDGTNVEIQEATGAPGINVEYRIDSVANFCSIAVSFHYDGSASHAIDVEIYDDTNTTWRTVFSQKDEELNYIYYFCDFPGTIANYINSSDQVKIRFYHPVAGITSHDLFINYVSIVGETT